MSRSQVDRLAADVRDRLPMSDVVGRKLRLRRAGREWKAPCPFHNERTPSFYVNDRKRFGHCFGCGWHGDVIRFLQHHDNLEFLAALEQAAFLAGLSVTGAPSKHRQQPKLRPLMPPPPTQEEIERERDDDIKTARSMFFDYSRKPQGTLVETYWRARGIELTPTDTFRFVARHHHYDSNREWPAMLAAVQNPSGRVVAVHQTWLLPDGSGKIDVKPAKKIFGPYFTGATRLTAAAEHLYIAEGIETALSVLQAMPGVAIWAALSLDNIAGRPLGKWIRHPDPERKTSRLPPVEPDMDRPGIVLPPIVRRVTILADSDNKDKLSASRRYACAVRRFQKLGLEVDLAEPPDGMDFNDMLLSGSADKEAA